MFKTRYKISWHYRSYNELLCLYKEGVSVNPWCYMVKRRKWYSPLWSSLFAFDKLKNAEKYIDRISNPDIKKF